MASEIRTVQYQRVTNYKVDAAHALELRRQGFTLDMIQAALGTDASIPTISRAILRQTVTERTAFVRERIFKRLEASSSHAQLTPEERGTLADSLAQEAMSFDQPGYIFNSSPAATPFGKDEVNSDRFQMAMLPEPEDI